MDILKSYRNYFSEKEIPFLYPYQKQAIESLSKRIILLLSYQPEEASHLFII